MQMILAILKGLEYIFYFIIYVLAFVVGVILWIGFVIVEAMKGIGILIWKTIMK